MSHVHLAKVLRFSNILRNVFGASPFVIHPEESSPKDMVVFTRFSKWAPAVTFATCIISFAMGVFVQLGSKKSGAELPGIDMQIGSLAMIIMELTVLSALIAYLTGNYITYSQRDEFRNSLVVVFELMEVIERKYKQKNDPKELTLGVGITLIVLPVYYFAYLFFFKAFIYNASESLYLIPFAFMIQSISASMAAFDIASLMHCLGDIFIAFEKVSNHLIDGEFFTRFASAVDLFQVIGKNHGHRELFNVANEFIVILSQTFLTCYSLSQSVDKVQASILYMAVGGVLPRLIKVFYIAHRGSITTQHVSVIFSFLSFEL